MITVAAQLGGTISVDAALVGNVCLPATYTLINTAVPPDTLDSGSIPSGGSDTIVAPPVTILVNGQPYTIAPSGTTEDVPVQEPLTGELDVTQAPVYYIGWTENGTDYIITRITRNPDETVITAEAVGAWADRYTLIYG